MGTLDLSSNFVLNQTTMNKTIQNLTKAFIGESQARNRYTLYAKIAKKEGYEQISEIFLLTAENEREHAKWLLRMINDIKKESAEELDQITVEADASTILGTTKENLQDAINGESYENEEMYPEFANFAKEEGYPEIAKRLRAIGAAEDHHKKRYQELLKQVENETVWKKEEKVEWVCRKCGYVHTGTTPPKECPSCDHPSNYFEIKSEKY